MMDIEIKFPEPRPVITVETDMVKEIIGSTMANCNGGGSSLWYGNTGIGKTTTGRLFAQKVVAAYERDPANPNAFMAKHFQVGEIPPWSGNEQKQGIKTLHAGTLGTMDEGEYRNLPITQLAKNTVYGLMRARTRIILIDEAGCLSLDAIRGMMLVRDISEEEEWTITLIFIGMDDLPKKLDELPQIRRRIHHWRYFEEYKFDGTWELLAKLHSHFDKFDRKNKEHHAQVKFIHDTLGGYPGLIVPFLNQMDYLMGIHNSVVDEKFLRTVHYLMTHGKNEALAKSNKLGRKPPARKPSGK